MFHLGDLDSDLLYGIVSAFLVIVAGLMSGLTLGLLSVTETELEVLKRSGTPQERGYAEQIATLVSRPHHLLVTLVLINASATEALPLCLDRLYSPAAAVVVSVIVVLVFGEIIPQAVCTRYGLAVGAKCAFLVRALMCITAPIAWPVSKVLDHTLGTKHSSLFRRRGLKALVEVHGAEGGLGGNLTSNEIHVIQHALDLTSKCGQSSGAYTPLDQVFMLPADAVLDTDTLMSVLACEHSRVPVYECGDRTKIVGVIMTRELALVEISKPELVSKMHMRSLPYVPSCIALYDLLQLFLSSKCHMAILTTCEDTPQTDGPMRSPLTVEGDGDGLISVIVDSPIPSHMRSSEPGSPCIGHASTYCKLNSGVARVEIADEVPGKSGLGVPIGIITLDDIMRQLLPPPTSLSSLPVHLHKGMRQFVPRVGCVEDLKRPLLSGGRQF